MFKICPVLYIGLSTHWHLYWNYLCAHLHRSLDCRISWNYSMLGVCSQQIAQSLRHSSSSMFLNWFNISSFLTHSLLPNVPHTPQATHSESLTVLHNAVYFTPSSSSYSVLYLFECPHCYVRFPWILLHRWPSTSPQHLRLYKQLLSPTFLPPK